MLGLSMEQVKIMGFPHTRNVLLEPNTMNILDSLCFLPPQLLKNEISEYF